jgi:hypothetical protein
MPGGLTKSRGQRPCGHDRPDARHDKGNSRQDESAQFSEPRCGARLLHFSAGRGVHLMRESAFLVVIAANDRDLIARHPGPMQRPRGCGRGRWMIEKTEDDWVHLQAGSRVPGFSSSRVLVPGFQGFQGFFGFGDSKVLLASRAQLLALGLKCSAVSAGTKNREREPGTSELWNQNSGTLEPGTGNPLIF